MNDKELQKIIDTKNGTISVLKDTVKKWVREYNMLDACIELQNEKINAYKMSENEANEIIAELKAENVRLKSYLQEIKAIVCGNYEIIDPQGREDILKLINKAEEE